MSVTYLFALLVTDGALGMDELARNRVRDRDRDPVPPSAAPSLGNRSLSLSLSLSPASEFFRTPGFRSPSESRMRVLTIC